VSLTIKTIIIVYFINNYLIYLVRHILIKENTQHDLQVQSVFFSRKK